jgi:hypothetical protein
MVLAAIIAGLTVGQAIWQDSLTPFGALAGSQPGLDGASVAPDRDRHEH